LAVYLDSYGAAVGALAITDGGVGRLGSVALGFSVAALLAVPGQQSPGQASLMNGEAIDAGNTHVATDVHAP
jgi:hypothetical protein